MFCFKFIYCYVNYDLCYWVKTFIFVRNNVVVCYFNSVRLEEAGGRFWYFRYFYFIGREKFYIIKVI